MAKDPSVDIIYVAPFEIQKDVFEYYMKFLQVNRHFIQHEMRALYPFVSPHCRSWGVRAILHQGSR